MSSASQSSATSSTPLGMTDMFDKKPFQNNASTAYGVCIPLLVMCWITTMGRLGTRFYITKNPGWDDMFVALTLATVTTATISFFVSFQFGMGQHIFLLDSPTLEKSFVCHYIFGATYANSTAFIKISLLLQYLRIFKRGTWIYRLCQLMLIFLGLWTLAWIIVCWGICLPDPSTYWKGLGMTGRGCYATGSHDPTVVVASIEAHSAVNVFQDLVVLSIPTRLLFEKDAPTKRRHLSALLFMGFVTCVFAVWRLQYIVASSGGTNGGDLTWQEPAVILLSMAELYIASLCASIPFFWPIIAKQINKIMVMYEFSVQTESRYRDDEVELAHSESWPAGSKGENKSEDAEVSESRSQEGVRSKASHYTDDYITNQVNPFSEEFRAEATVQAAPAPKSKGGFVRFDH